MLKKILPALLMLLILLPISARAGEIEMYKDGETTLEGYLAKPDAEKFPGARPAILIAHQWKGLTDYEKHRADMLADLGYIAFAVDVYGQGIRPATSEEAMKQSSIYKNDPALARQRMNVGLTHLLGLPGVDKEKIAAFGYCFGGTMALELARSGADLKAVIPFHGGLATKEPAAKGVIKAPILAHHGANDPYVTKQEVADFEKEMDEAGADWQLVTYANAVHAFTQKEAGDDPSQGAAYNEKADHRSWAYTLDFLNQIFK
ncbi:MAG: dienelactone hydrolase family protein [Alphaproteobacteria bacterium]|nr:dienelactone hydrolase family protein [Alphaproteobacteria bacterium]